MQTKQAHQLNKYLIKRTAAKLTRGQQTTGASLRACGLLIRANDVIASVGQSRDFGEHRDWRLKQRIS
jgi:hypothetical protein